MSASFRHVLAAVALVCIGRTLCEADPIELKSGDRVVVLGSALIERDAEHNYLETFLAACSPAENVVFRNLGWSGDTVWADARAMFDQPADGFRRMQEQIKTLAPTWIIVAYGGNEAFAGEGGVTEFVAGLNRLLDGLAETGARLVLVTPHRHESLGAPLPSADAQNRNLLLYAQAVRKVATERGLPLFDLTERLVGSPSNPLTENGLHLSDYGYWRFAVALADEFKAQAPSWRVELSVDAGPQATSGTRLDDIEITAESARFTAHDMSLPAPPCPGDANFMASEAWPESDRTLKITGLTEGRYELRIDGKPAATGTATDWASGVKLITGPEFEQIALLRNVIGQKNELYFHRWRPQNDTYLLGFRKYEQGQNAIEIPQFDPLVAQREASIASLRRPVPHRYELICTMRPSVEADPAAK